METTNFHMPTMQLNPLVRRSRTVRKAYNEDSTILPAVYFCQLQGLYQFFTVFQAAILKQHAFVRLHHCRQEPGLKSKCKEAQEAP